MIDFLSRPRTSKRRQNTIPASESRQVNEQLLRVLLCTVGLLEQPIKSSADRALLKVYRSVAEPTVAGGSSGCQFSAGGAAERQQCDA